MTFNHLNSTQSEAVPLTPNREITDYKPQSPQRTQRETKKKIVKFDRVEFERLWIQIRAGSKDSLEDSLSVFSVRSVVKIN